MNNNLIKVIFSIICMTFSCVCYSQNSIYSNYKNGVNYLECKVNGTKMEFIFDTGASDVKISLEEALLLLKNGQISETNFIGISYYKIANGEIEENTQIILDEIEIAGYVIENVKAAISHKLNAPMLLGNSLIRKFDQVNISGNKITFYPKNEFSFQGYNYNKNKIFLFTQKKERINTLNEFSKDFCSSYIDNKLSSILECYKECVFDDLDNDNIAELIITGGLGNSSSSVHVFKSNDKTNFFLVDSKYFPDPEPLIIVNNEIFVQIHGASYPIYSCNKTILELPNYVPQISTFILKGNNLVDITVTSQFNKMIIENIEYLNSKPIPQLANDCDDGTRYAIIEQFGLLKRYNLLNDFELAEFYNENFYFPEKEEIWNIIKD